MRGLLFCLLLWPALRGSPQVDSVRLDRSFLKHMAADSRDYFLSPLRWEGRDWLRVAAFSGATILVTLADEPVRDFFGDARSPLADGISRYGGEPLGSEYSLLVAGGFILAGELSGNGRARSTGYLAAESMLLSGLLVRVPKLLLGRQRPDAWPPATPYTFKGPFRGSSFPSGHTTLAFSLATVIADQYSSVKWVPAVSYSLAGIAGLSRIYDRRHWASDVFAGAVIGVVTGHYVTGKHREKRLSLVPASITGIPAVQLSCRW